MRAEVGNAYGALKDGVDLIDVRPRREDDQAKHGCQENGRGARVAHRSVLVVLRDDLCEIENGGIVRLTDEIVHETRLLRKSIGIERIRGQRGVAIAEEGVLEHVGGRDSEPVERLRVDL